MFIDHVILEVVAGRGGDGCVSFRREKYVPRGGPDGGNGGRGGDVLMEATDRVATLVDLHYRSVYKAGNGANGQGRSRRGRDGADAVIRVPPGTVIKDIASGRTVGELLEDGDRCVVAKGGRGGWGNERFKSPRNRAPRKSTPGHEGDRSKLEVTLKLIAEVGLVGEPNAGKSTLLRKVSAALPKIAAYPFTTKTPVLGIVKVGDFDSFVMVDIPGLIEGAHAGKGMGREFLRHIERCWILLYLVDASQPDPGGSYEALRNELLRYDPKLLEKPSALILTKCDLLDGGAESIDLELLKIHGRVFPISALKGDGLGPLLTALHRMLRKDT
jgi:GTP-binding protein